MFVFYVCGSVSVLPVCLFSTEVQKNDTCVRNGLPWVTRDRGFPHGFYIISAFSITESSAWKSATTSCSANRGTLIYLPASFSALLAFHGVFPSLWLYHSFMRCISPCGESWTGNGPWRVTFEKQCKACCAGELVSRAHFYILATCFLMARALSNVTSWYSARVQLFVTLWTVACQAPLSMQCPRQEHWRRLPFPSPWALPNSGKFPALAGRFFFFFFLPLNHQGSPREFSLYLNNINLLSFKINSTVFCPLEQTPEDNEGQGSLLCCNPWGHKELGTL